MNANELLESELRVLANEVKSKNSSLKEKLEKLIAELRISTEVPTSSILTIMSQAITVPSLQGQGVCVLQRMLSLDILSSDTMLLALELLHLLSRQTEESVQLKVTQTIMQVLNPSSITINEGFVQMVWKVLMELESAKSSLSRNTAVASLRQLVSLTFDNIATSPSSAHFILTNVLQMTAGNHHLWKSELNKQKREGIDLFLFILKTYNHVLTENLAKMISENAEGVLGPFLSEEIEDSVFQKAIECAVLVVQVTRQSLRLIEIVSMIPASRKISHSQQQANLNAMHPIFSDPELVYSLYKANILQGLLNSLNILSHECFNNPDDSKLQTTKIIADLISKVIDSLATLAQRSDLKLGEMAHFPLTERSSEVEKLLLDLWRFLVPVLSMIATHCWDESLLQTVLNSYQAIINISGTLNCSVAREGFLTSLASLCLPAKSKKLTSKNIYACKTMFNITHCLGSILDVKAWHRVLDVLYKLDYFINTSGKRDERTDSDVHILNSALESLFTNTQDWSDSNLIDLISALGQLTLEFMESLATSEQKIAGMKVFGLEKMIIVAQSNLERVTLFWEMLGAYLHCICNSKYPEIREMGISSISRILIRVFKYFLENPPEKWKDWQRTLFLSLHDLSASNYSDTQEAVFQAIFGILQSCGGDLDSSGWSMILFILSKVEASPSAFKCLQLIVSDFLQSPEVLPSIEKLITCISKIAQQKDDINQAISAVGMYWNVADFVGREQEQVWWTVLAELKVIGEDPRPEVRHSAIQSLHVALATHGSNLSGENWLKIIEEIILSLLDKITQVYFSQDGGTLASEGIIVHHSRDTIEKQWEETYQIFTQNLGKIFRSFINCQDVEHANTWTSLLNKLRLGIKQGSINIVNAVIKAIIDLVTCKQIQDLFFATWSVSWGLFQDLGGRLPDIKLPTKMVSVIIEGLGAIVKSDRPEIFQDENMEDLFSIIKGLIQNSKNENTLKECKLLIEQREIFAFLEQIGEHCASSKANPEIFIKFLLGMCVYDESDMHSDPLCRKSLEILTNFYASAGLEICIEDTLNCFRTLSFSRFDPETREKMKKTAKGALPLWVAVTEPLLKFLKILIQAQKSSVVHEFIESMINHSERTTDELIGEQVDAKLIGFVIECLLDSSEITEIDKLVQMVDRECRNIYNTIHGWKYEGSLSSVCLSGLFKLAQIRPDNLSVLVERCRNSIRQFVEHENNCEEILDILNHMFTLSLDSEQPKKHIALLFGDLCELISTDKSDIREILKQVLQDISDVVSSHI